MIREEKNKLLHNNMVLSFKWGNRNVCIFVFLKSLSRKIIDFFLELWSV